MNKLQNILISILSLLIMISCVTTEKNTVSNQKGYNPVTNEFEEKSWISYNPIELYQDRDFLYIQLSYTSTSEGKYSLFNPPNGASFMLKGDLGNGHSVILERVEKSMVKGIEGITMLFFPGDFSNESESTGLFFHSGTIKWNNIPVIPEGKFQEMKLQPISNKENRNIEVTSNVDETTSNSAENSKDHGVVKEVVNDSIEISEKDLVFRSTLQDKIDTINIDQDGRSDIQSIFGEPVKLTYFSNGKRMTMQYSDKFYVIIIPETDKIDELRIHNPGYTTTQGIQVGSSLDEVINAYGNPDEIIRVENLNVKRQSGRLYKLPNFSYYLIQDKNIRFFFDEFNNVSALYLLSSHFVNE